MQVQRALEYPFADIDDRNYDLRYNYGNGVLRSIEVFELVQQGLVREAQEIQKWLALEDPTPENVSCIRFVQATEHDLKLFFLGSSYIKCRHQH